MAMSEAAPRRRPTLLDWGLLALLGLIWGGAFLGVELSLDSLAPLQVSTARIVLAALLLIAVAFLAGDGLPGFATPCSGGSGCTALEWGCLQTPSPSPSWPGASSL